MSNGSAFSIVDLQRFSQAKMHTYTITKKEEFEKYKDSYGYVVCGNLKVDCHIEFDKNLLVLGRIEIGENGQLVLNSSHWIKAYGGSNCVICD